MTEPMDPSAQRESALRSVSLPGTLLVVSGAIGLAYIVAGAFFEQAMYEAFARWIEGMGQDASQLRQQFENPSTFDRVLSIGSRSLGAVAQVLVIVGGLRMRQLRSWGLALTGAILAAIPCFGCCCVGLPIGIWAILVLVKSDVKTAFARA